MRPPRKLIGHRREAELALGIVEQVVLARPVPHRDMHMAAIAGEIDEGLRHEGGAEPVLLGDRLHHELEEGKLIGGGQRVVEIPVDLELAVGVLVVVLIGRPSRARSSCRQISAMTSRRRMIAAWS